MKTSTVIPIFRIFDECRAREFYVQYLGFSVDWEHRFAYNYPLYLQVSLDRCSLHLSAHHGDCCPGGAVRIEVDDVVALRDRLKGSSYMYSNPEFERKPWGAMEMVVVDPFGNRLIFYQRVAPAESQHTSLK